MGLFSLYLGLLQHTGVCQLTCFITQAAQKGNTDPVQPKTTLQSPANRTRRLTST